MSDVTFRPLNWTGPSTPDHKRRGRGTFGASWHDTLEMLKKELGYLKAEHIVIEADFADSDIRLDGYPRSNARAPKHPGIRVAFDSKYGPLIYQTDSCVFWQHNVRSIALGLQALRAVDRYGVTKRGEQYTGWKAIGSGGNTQARAFDTPEQAAAWLRREDVLGFHGGGGLTIKSLLRYGAKACHPDTGGSRENWDKYEQARDLLTEAGMV